LAKDNDGTAFRVRSDNPRWMSGELVGFNKNTPAHPNTVAAAKNRKGIAKTKEHCQKVSDSMKKLKWYYNIENDVVKRFEENSQPTGFVRISGPHKKMLL